MLLTLTIHWQASKPPTMWHLLSSNTNCHPPTKKSRVSWHRNSMSPEKVCHLILYMISRWLNDSRSLVVLARDAGCGPIQTLSRSTSGEYQCRPILSCPNSAAVQPRLYRLLDARSFPLKDEIVVSVFHRYRQKEISIAPLYLVPWEPVGVRASSNCRRSDAWYDRRSQGQGWGSMACHTYSGQHITGWDIQEKDLAGLDSNTSWHIF